MAGMSDAARLGAIEARCVRIVRQSLDLAPVRGIERSTHFARDLGADRLDMLTLVMAVSKVHGRAVPGSSIIIMLELAIRSFFAIWRLCVRKNRASTSSA